MSYKYLWQLVSGLCVNPEQRALLGMGNFVSRLNVLLLTFSNLSGQSPCCTSSYILNSHDHLFYDGRAGSSAASVSILLGRMISSPFFCLFFLFKLAIHEVSLAFSALGINFCGQHALRSCSCRMHPYGSQDMSNSGVCAW